MYMKFMPGAAWWLKLCKLLSLNGADAVSAEMTFTIVHCLCLDSDMDIAAAAYLCIMWGCQCGRQDVSLKSDLMHHMGYNRTQVPETCRCLARRSSGWLKKLDFNVRAFGLTAIEVAHQETGPAARSDRQVVPCAHIFSARRERRRGGRRLRRPGAGWT